MKASIGIAAAALALALTGCGDEGGDLNAAAANQAGPVEQIPPPQNGDWTQIVEQSAEGGFRMGNPDAPVKLVEYASMTCPACAQFAAQGTPELVDTYVRSGQVSWEFRNFLLGAPDVALAVLARCQPPGAYFGTVDQIFSRQREFLENIDETEGQRISGLPPEQQIAPLARAMELDTFFARRGMPEARFDECLSNSQAVEELTEMTNRAATELDVRGTPTFFINGEQVQASDWGALEPQLRAAIGG